MSTISELRNAFRIALSGLNAASAGLRTTANNIANAGTTGFRQSRAEFAEQIAAGAAGSGVRTARIAQQQTQGNI
jgi:flagellar hook protein FlgE